MMGKRVLTAFAAGIALGCLLSICIFWVSRQQAPTVSVSEPVQGETRVADSHHLDEQVRALTDTVASLRITASQLELAFDRLNAEPVHAGVNSDDSYASNFSSMEALRSAWSVDSPTAYNVQDDYAAPTLEQEERYQGIKSRLHNTALDHSVPLFELAGEIRMLSAHQQQELIQEAMEMVQRGELVLEQFYPH